MLLLSSQACASGYKRNGDACEVCDGQGCDTFADGSCTCAVCLTGYALDAESGACRQCPENQACEAYEPNSCNCVTCTSGSAGPLCMPVSKGPQRNSWDWGAAGKTRCPAGTAEQMCVHSKLPAGCIPESTHAGLVATDLWPSVGCLLQSATC